MEWNVFKEFDSFQNVYKYTKCRSKKYADLIIIRENTYHLSYLSIVHLDSNNRRKNTDHFLQKCNNINQHIMFPFFSYNNTSCFQENTGNYCPEGDRPGGPEGEA